MMQMCNSGKSPLRAGRGKGPALHIGGSACTDQAHVPKEDIIHDVSATHIGTGWACMVGLTWKSWSRYFWF